MHFRHSSHPISIEIFFIFIASHRDSIHAPPTVEDATKGRYREQEYQAAEHEVLRHNRDSLDICRTLKMCHDCRWRARCAAAGVTAVVVVHYRLVRLIREAHYWVGLLSLRLEK